MFSNMFKRCFFGIAFVVMLFIALLTTPASAATHVIRTDGINGVGTPAGSGNGWGSNAYLYLQDALDEGRDHLVNEPGDTVEIWVLGSGGDGVPYKANEWAGHTGDQDDSFIMTEQIRIYGGFDSGDDDLADRNPVANLTILNGDLDDDDEGVPDGVNVTWDENSQCIVRSNSVDGNARIEGFTIRHGYNLGQGVSGGSGMYNYLSDPRVTKCIFHQNYSNTGGGAGMRNDTSSPIVLNCLFLDNHVQGVGNGGGMYNRFNASPQVINCRFIDNSSGHVGGGLSARDNDEEMLEMQIINCTFVNNHANQYGGGIRIGYDTSANIVNCTFVGNSAGTAGGGIGAGRDTSNDTGSVRVDNCIFWDNDAPSGYGPQIGLAGAYPVEMTITYTNIQNRLTGGVYDQFSTLVYGEGMMDTDPQFVDSPDDLRLGDISPCINVAKCSSVPPDTYDADGDSDTGEPTPDLDLLDRYDPDYHRVDMGAYENQTVLNCNGDADRSGLVNVQDIIAVVINWAQGTAGPDLYPFACGNGVVNIDDLLAVINNWGYECPTEDFISVGSFSSVQDCIDAADLLYTPYSENWDTYVYNCIDGLCKAEIIECD